MNLLGSSWDKRGVYIIFNVVSFNYYIGSTISFQKRNWSYRTDLENGKCHNIPLQRAHDKSNKLIMLPFVVTDEYLRVEKELIELLKPTYNLRVVELGEFKYTHTDDAKAKIGDAHRGKIVSDETRQRISNSRSSRATSDVEREARRRAALKRWADPEKRVALIAAQKAGVAKASPRKYPGRKITDEHRSKLAIATRRRWARVRASKSNSSDLSE